MKNKILAALLAVVLAAGQIQAEEQKKEKDPFQLVSGGLLVVVGAMASYLGFNMNNVSLPRISMQSFTWNDSETSPGSWEVSSSGTLQNSGNLDLRNITVTVEYKDFAGVLIQSQTVPIDTKTELLKPAETDTFSSSLTGLAYDPQFVSARFRADFTEEFVNTNITTGVIGSAVAAIGVFFICDYFFNITDFFLKQEIQVQLSALDGGFSFITSKNF